MGDYDEKANQGCIYRLYCQPTGKSYIGQTPLYKWNETVSTGWVRYGAEGRFISHVSEAKVSNRNTPLIQAIREHGREAFVVETVYHANIDQLNMLETAYIRSYNTVVPNGYNKSDHGRRVGAGADLAAYYASISTAVNTHVWRRNGVRRIIVLDLTLEDGEMHRLHFGSGAKDTYENALAQANKFLEPFQQANIPIKVDPAIYSDNPVDKYNDRLAYFEDKTITRVTYSYLLRGDNPCVMVSVTTLEDGPKFPKRILFVDQKFSLEEKYQIARQFVARLSVLPTTKIVDKVEAEIIKVHSRQPPLRLRIVPAPMQEPGVSQIPVP